MDHPWRPRPPIQGNICPTCSVSHFPFCPPAHPQFNQNPNRFQPYNDYFPHRPRFESFVDHREPPAVNLRRPFGGDPHDGFVDRRAWPGSNPNFDMNPYGVDPAVMDGYYHNRNSFENGGYGYGGAGVKRMRVDEGGGEVYMNSTRFSGEVSVDSSRFSSESERISKLIREHGNAARGPPGVSLLTEPTREAPAVAEPPARGGYEYKKFDELQEIGDERMVKRRSNYEMGDVQNQGVDYFDRNEPPFPVRPGLNSHSFRGDHGSGFANTYVQNIGDDQLGKSHFGPVENSIGHSLDHNRYNNLSAERFTSIERSQQTSADEVAPLYNGAVSYESNLWSESEQSTQRRHYQSSQMLHENHHNLQQFPRCEGPHEPHTGNNQLSPPCTVQNHFPPNGDFLAPRPPSDTKPSAGGNVTMRDDFQGSVPHRNLHGWSKLEEESRYPPISFGNNIGPREISHQYNVQPPLPTSPPPPPLPMVPPSKAFPKPLPPSPPANKPSLFPIAVSSSADMPPSHLPAPQAHSLIQTYYSSKHQHSSTSTSSEEFQACQLPMKKYLGESQSFPSRHLPLEKPNVVDARNIFKKPHRKSRPDHLVIILRGLPGSGKSYLAKMLRDLEVENGGEAPRIHSMDEYFMTEVEKAEESEASKSSGSIRGKKPVMKKVMEYCYEPEMEDAYRSSMLKAFKKTLDEGVFSFIIVDDRNLRVADFAQFWATAKRSGFEVYLLEATYTDPAGCAARNVHNFTLNDIQKMADLWEEAPSLYLKLDIKSLLHGDDLEQSGIQEVDMDMEDGNPEDSSRGSHFTVAEDVIKAPMDDFGHHDVGPLKVAKKSVESHQTEELKELRRSKWSDDWDDNDSRGAEDRKGNPSALSGLIQAYSKGGKSVCWADQAGNVGFSIGAATRTNVMSLIIGPGSGYNSKSNPLSKEEHLISTSNSVVKSNAQSRFQERMRAERESFKAVFDKRRQRIHGFNMEEE